MNAIDQLLLEIKEDKKDNLSTTSFLFKRDIWEFFQGFTDQNCVEFGTHKGQTTRILSHLFNEVYTLNLPNHFESAMRLNSDRSNISYIPIDLYNQSVDINFEHLPISVCFIDAMHTYDAVLMDVDRCANLTLTDDVYIIFDDYGAYLEVWNAIHHLIDTDKLEIVKYIGHAPDHNFGGTPNRIISDHEGVICKLIR